jgi:hypothetical protein
MLLYSLLYLTGVKDMTLDELKRFRQINSKTAGHPEYKHADGIETTTGPLGPGVANAVGFALAERILNARFGDELCKHWTYVFMGDGCLMEGISQEAISMAGHFKLGHLIAFWDNNSISIDGATSRAVSDNEVERFRASGASHTPLRVRAPERQGVAGRLEEGDSGGPHRVHCERQGNGDPFCQRCRARPSRCRHPGTAGRLCRSDALEQHEGERHDRDQARRIRRHLHALWRSRARHGRCHERQRAVRRPDPVRRHLPLLLGLLPPVHPTRGPDAGPDDLRHDA